MHTVRVRTAQNVDIEYPVASVGERILAAIIDYAILFAYAAAVVIAFAWGARYLERFALPYFVILFTPAALYDFLCELFLGGQSIGKKALRIKVVKLDGSQPSIGSYLIRWALRIVDIALFSPMVAIVVILVNGRGQRIGDIAAGTAVISLKERAALHDTLFVPLETNYRPVYEAAARLGDRTASLLREALAFEAKNRNTPAARKVIEKAATVAAAKLGAEVPADRRGFLMTVLKDYNYYHDTAT